jgi:hypothetical protein
MLVCHIVALISGLRFWDKILPAAQRSLDSAVANYTSGRLGFLRLLHTERQLSVASGKRNSRRSPNIAADLRSWSARRGSPLVIIDE